MCLSQCNCPKQPQLVYESLTTKAIIRFKAAMRSCHVLLILAAPVDEVGMSTTLSNQKK